MTKGEMRKIKELLSLLTPKESDDGIIQITKNNNPEVYEYLDNQGPLFTEYFIETEVSKTFQRRIVNTHLWDKTLDKVWDINIFQINEILNMQWKE